VQKFEKGRQDDTGGTRAVEDEFCYLLSTLRRDEIARIESIGNSPSRMFREKIV
jgi:hypothetical protein